MLPCFAARLGPWFCAALFAATVCAHAAAFRTINTFCTTATGCRDGKTPQELVADVAGNLYGTAKEYGAYRGHGVIFELVGGLHFKVIYTFCKYGRRNVCPDGSTPGDRLIIDKAGNLYGVTTDGGTQDKGVVFELIPNPQHTAWTLTTLHNFCDTGDPTCLSNVYPPGPGAGFAYAGSASGMPYDGTSPLYGVLGGSDALPGMAGGIYALTPGSSWTISLLHAFCQNSGSQCPDGATPLGTMAMDAAGNLFGNTYGGGSSHLGVVFELVAPPPHGSWMEVVLHTFCTEGFPLCPDGESPSGDITLDAAGNIYGTTAEGGRPCISGGAGSTGCGVIYKIAPNGIHSVETVLHYFCAKTNCTDGAYPSSGLAMDAAATLYGMAQYGGGHAGITQPGGAGALFSLQGSTYTVLHRFCAFAHCSDGQAPQNTPTLAAGVLYGDTETTVFRYRLTPPSEPKKPRASPAAFRHAMRAPINANRTPR